MDTKIVIDILFWIHMVSLGLGGVATFGIPVVGSKMAAATTETRAVLFSIIHRLSTMGRAAVGLLIITGPLMLWLKSGTLDGISPWFWVKMVFVVVLLGLVIFAGINLNRAEKGDLAAAQRAPVIGMAAIATFLAIIACSVLTFH